MPQSPSSKRLVVEPGTNKAAGSQQLPQRSKLLIDTSPTDVTPSRPQRFNAKGDLVAIAGIPLKGLPPQPSIGETYD
jgi:hypothetical protein